MTTPVPPSGASAMMTLRILVGALLSSAVFITIAVFFVLAVGESAYAVTVFAAAPLLLGLAAHGLCETVGYRMPAITPGTPQQSAEQQSRALFQQRTTLRFAICEAVLMVSLAGAFVLGPGDGGLTTYLVGAVVAVALVWWHCWPRERVFARCQESLERAGATSYLREAYGLPPARGAAVKEL